jgi:hypothetical protein
VQIDGSYHGYHGFILLGDNTTAEEFKAAAPKSFTFRKGRINTALYDIEVINDE